MTRHFPFIDPKIQNELDFEKGPPAHSIPQPPGPETILSLSFPQRSRHTGTLTHNGAIARGSGDTDTDQRPPLALILKVGIIVGVSSRVPSSI